jgi:hypothetical protein
MENRLLEIQDILFNQMKRISDDKLPTREVNKEISRSNAITNNAMTFIKTVNVNIRVMELAQKEQKTEKYIKEKLGL